MKLFYLFILSIQILCLAAACHNSKPVCACDKTEPYKCECKKCECANED